MRKSFFTQQMAFHLAAGQDFLDWVTAHRDNPDTAVIDTLLRNHPPRPAFFATWMDGRFVYDLEAAVVTGKGGKYDAAFIEYIRHHPGDVYDKPLATFDRLTAGPVPGHCPTVSFGGTSDEV